MAAKIDTSTAAPAPKSAQAYTPKFARPIAQQRPNFIPAQSWLGYSWLDKDPELDFVIWAIGESGWSAERIEAETEKNGHKVSKYTILAWTFGSTRRPQNVTMNTVMAALGYDRTWHRR